MNTAPPAPPLVTLLQFLVSGVVSHPQSIRISRVETQKTDLFYLNVGQDDLGRLLGREGKTIEAIRVMMDVAATQYGKNAIVDVIEPRNKSGDHVGPPRRRGRSRSHPRRGRRPKSR